MYFLQTKTFCYITIVQIKNQEINIDLSLLFNFQIAFIFFHLFINCPLYLKKILGHMFCSVFVFHNTDIFWKKQVRYILQCPSFLSFHMIIHVSGYAFSTGIPQTWCCVILSAQGQEEQDIIHPIHRDITLDHWLSWYVLGFFTVKILLFCHL